VVRFGYASVQTGDGKLPLLAPMSEIAGRMAAQVVAHYLEKPSGGAGILLGGAPGVPPARVLVIGVGVVGFEAARVALGMGAQVTVADRNLDRLREVEHLLGGRFATLASNPGNVRQAVAESDAVIGAVLIPGARAPRVVTRAMLAQMRPGGVVVDVAIDQGGCFETSRPTSHTDPTYVEEGVLHYCVTNMPGAVPHTSTVATSSPSPAPGCAPPPRRTRRCGKA
jgi:alanine dehydrogenase